MSEIDENQIHDRLKRLSQIEPAQDAAERAMKRVRETLTGQQEERRRVAASKPKALGMAERDKAIPKLRLRLPPVAGPIGRLAAAAVVLIAAGFLAGRLSAPPPVDTEELRAELEASLTSSLEPAIRQNVLDEADRRWQSVFAAGCAQLKDELAQQVRRDLTQFAAQSLTASGVQTQRQLRELIQLIEAARIQDRRNVEVALEHIESQFGNGLVTLAAHTNELQRPE
jgi:hypothetical protein